MSSNRKPDLANAVRGALRRPTESLTIRTTSRSSPKRLEADLCVGTLFPSVL
jgi:hypothetical protein